MFKYFFYVLHICPPLIRHSSISPSWFPTHPRPPPATPVKHAPPQVNRNLKWLCLRWWSGCFPSNSVRMPHIHLPLAYSNQPSIIDAYTHARLRPARWSQHSITNTHTHPSRCTHTHPDVHMDAQSLYPSITARSRCDSSSGTRNAFPLILFRLDSVLSKRENVFYN